MTAVKNFSRTASNNNGSPPDGFPEAQTAGSLNNSARELMKAIVDEATNGECRLLASVAGTDTITASCTPDITAYNAGMLFVFTPAADNTGAATLNIDSVGALDIQKYNAEALTAKDLRSGVPAVVQLDAGADDFILLNPLGARAPTGSNASALEIGYKGIPQNAQSGNYTLVLTDAGKEIYYNGAGGHTYTIPANASVAFPIGSFCSVFNPGAALTIAITSDTLVWVGPGSTGSRTLAQYGLAFLYKYATTNWRVSGVGLS